MKLGIRADFYLRAAVGWGGSALFSAPYFSVARGDEVLNVVQTRTIIVVMLSVKKVEEEGKQVQKEGWHRVRDRDRVAGMPSLLHLILDNNGDYRDR